MAAKKAKSTKSNGSLVRSARSAKKKANTKKNGR